MYCGTKQGDHFGKWQNYVIIYKSKCDLTVKEVELIKTVADMAYIKTGLKEGDKVISQNQILLFKALTEK